MAKTTNKNKEAGKTDEAKAKEVIDEILKKIDNRECLFRGTSKKYSDEPDGIRSSLYHWAVENGLKQKDITTRYPPFEMEKRIVDAARKHFPSNSSNLEIVTALRHFDGKVNAIDFSTDLYVALFFACARNMEEDGELIFVDEGNLKRKSKIDYEELSSAPDHSIILDPPYNEVSHSRVVAQKSAFVYSPKGYLDEEEYESYPIRKEVKNIMRKYLERVHGIYQEYIYNDLIGFIQIQTEKDRAKATLLTYLGNINIEPKR